VVSPIDTIVSFLSLQDDQGTDWYGWSSNQLSHAFLGAFFSGLVLVLGGAWYYAIALLVVLGIHLESGAGYHSGLVVFYQWRCVQPKHFVWQYCIVCLRHNFCIKFACIGHRSKNRSIQAGKSQ